jgi:hypothetical protein
MGERNEIKTLVEQGNISLWINWRRWEDNIKLDVKETSCDNLDWTHLDNDTHHLLDPVNTIMNLQFS